MGAVASVLLKDAAHYGRRHFIKGLGRLGYSVILEPLPDPSQTDVLLLWNRLPTQEHIARKYEEVGARVLIAENGWIGDGTFALCGSYHNGAGSWYVGARSRWPEFGIAVKPWRKGGDHVLVIPQRGMGPPGVAMPRSWTADVTERLSKITDRPIRVRYPSLRETPLYPDFDNVHAAVIWGSGAGIKALIAGIPVFHEMALWIGSDAATFGIERIETPLISDHNRDYMLHRLSWAMWKPKEIEEGDPFRCLLR